MKKGIQVAFAITLIIISIIATIWQTELLGNIIYAVVIPSFLLSIISFVSEIAEKCESNAVESAKIVSKTADLSDRLTETMMKNYKACNSDTPYLQGRALSKITDQQLKTIQHYTEATALYNVGTFFVNCRHVCDVISVVGYVLLFLSLILSPYAVKLLSVINLNCITLWSLTLLYFTLELKSEICTKLFCTLHKRYLKKAEQQVNDQE